MPIQWREQMSVGVAAIDDDHRHLIGMINRFEDLTKRSTDLYGKDEAAARTLLGSLAAYAREHFTREERIQQVAGYDGLAENKAQHGLLQKSLVDMIRRFQERGPQPITPEEMSAFLQHWLVDHLVKCDLKMRDHKFPKGAW